MPKVSCVMPCRNRQEIIAESIKSILDQTYDDFELVVVDDHSDPIDKTESVIEEFNDDRIKYFKLSDENGIGISSARNFGNMVSTGELIAVADSDDICYPNRFQRSVDEFEKSNCDIVYSMIDVWDPKTKDITKRDKNDCARDFDIEEFMKTDFIPHPTVMYKRSIVLDSPYNSFFRRSEDYDLLIRFFKHGYKFSFIPESLVKYRVHENQITKALKSIFDYSKIARKNYNK